MIEQGWSKFLRLSRDAPEIYPVLLASCAGLTFAVCIMGHNLFGNADVNLTRRDPYNVPPSEMDSIEERDAYAERMLRFRRNPLRRLVEGRAPAIFTSTNEKMSGLGYKQYTHGKHEKPVLLANSEHEMQED